ncbi:MAG: metallophosphoesterase family protein [Gemmataceae bacterium]|nr:metallophosphoesterase family protein [Gemmataceae bacterium]
MRTLILSDIHLGSKHCNAALVHEALDAVSFDRLILNGDTLNSVNLRKLTGSHWTLLDRFRKLGRSRELVLIRGNHDHEGDYDPSSGKALFKATPHRQNGIGTEPSGQTASAKSEDRTAANCGPEPQRFTTFNVLPALLEVPMHEDYRLDVGSRSFLVMHGDRFDPTLHYPIVTDVAGFCYQLTTRINKKLAKWLKKKSKRWGGVLELVRNQSIAHARKENVEGVITGHTHFAEDAIVEDIHYVNTGCWTEYPCSYVLVQNDDISLHFPGE